MCHLQENDQNIESASSLKIGNISHMYVDYRMLFRHLNAVIVIIVMMSFLPRHWSLRDDPSPNVLLRAGQEVQSD